MSTVNCQFSYRREGFDLHDLALVLGDAGGENFHGRYEYVPIQSMEKATEVIVNICKLIAER